MEDLRRGARQLLALILDGPARNTPEACAWASVLGAVLGLDRRRDAARAMRAFDLSVFTVESATAVAGNSAYARGAYWTWARGVHEVARRARRMRPAQQSRLLEILREGVY